MVRPKRMLKMRPNSQSMCDSANQSTAKQMRKAILAIVESN